MHQTAISQNWSNVQPVGPADPASPVEGKLDALHTRLNGLGVTAELLHQRLHLVRRPIALATSAGSTVANTLQVAPPPVSALQDRLNVLVERVENITAGLQATLDALEL